MFKRLYILLLLITISFSAANAQYINVNIYEQGSDGGRIPKAGVTVYVFVGRSDAEKALKRLKEGESIGPAQGVKAEEQTTGQTLQLRASQNSYLLLDDGMELENIEIVSCQQHGHQSNNGFVVDYTIKPKRAKTGNKFEDNVTRLKETNVKGKQTTGKEPPSIVFACGKFLTYDKWMYVDKEKGRSDARFAVIPLLLEVAKDSGAILEPAVLDGDLYHKTMYRRMGYARDKEGTDIHDKLGKFVVKDHYMTTGVMDSLRVWGTFEGYDDQKDYRIVGFRWYEDYDGVYDSERVLIWDGKPRRPQRYLDWKSALNAVNIPIDPSRYSRKELLDIRKGTDHLKLKFKVGDYHLDYDDSITVVELEKVIKRLNGIRSNPESELISVTIKGYSSPEGSYAVNSRLSHQRADEVKSILSNRCGIHSLVRVKFDSNNNIQPWSTVVSFLDSVNTDESLKMAAEVKAALASAGSSMDSQYAAMRKLSCYEWIKDNVLPTLRIVDIEYEATEARIIPAEETYQRYHAKEEGYYDGERLMPYQFYHLLPQLYDEAVESNTDEAWEGLERIARAAYNSADDQMKQLCWRHSRDKSNPILQERDSTYIEDGEEIVIHAGDTIGYNLKHSNNYLRPYELAAYYLTKCIIRKNQTNTKILLDYIDDSNNGLVNHKRDDTGKLREWWNDEAIVMNQVLLYCNDNDYQMAYKCAAQHLPFNDPKYHLFKMMLRALNCEWNVPEVVETIAASSPMNACAMYIAQNTKDYYHKADSLLQDTTLFDPLDSRVHYLRAIARFHTECPTCDDLSIKFYPASNIYDPNAREFDPDAKVEDWAAPMLEAFRLDEENVNILKNDGFFTDAYRTLVLYFWQRLKDGLTMDQISREYEALRQQYMSSMSSSK